jgi:Protein of unknown function (DUF2924)
MRRAPRAEGLTETLKTLPELGREDLIERWMTLYGGAPPPRTSRSLLIRAVAYKMQERVYGGLSASARRAFANETPSAKKVGSPASRAGTVLLREWHGVTHQVTIMEDGVLHRGKRHRSLSAVARIITGSRWSGPTFFGLNAKGSGRLHDTP